MPQGIIALVIPLPRSSGGSRAHHVESEQVAWLTREEVKDRMSEAFAVRITDALDFTGVPASTHPRWPTRRLEATITCMT
jgi:hypothetical protein